MSPARQRRHGRGGARRNPLVSLAALPLLALPVAGQAQTTRSDVELWSSLSASGQVSRNLDVRTDVLLTLRDNASRPGRELVRVVLLADVSDRLKIGGGYVWTHVDAGAGPHYVEHRAVQEVDFRTPLTKHGVTLTTRTQLEERLRERRNGISLRLRQLSRLDFPLGRAGVRAVFWNEYFHEFVRRDWSGRSGPSLMLNFAGVRVPVTRSIAVEPGYLNQTQFDAGRNRVRHIAAMFATVRF